MNTLVEIVSYKNQEMIFVSFKMNENKKYASCNQKHGVVCQKTIVSVEDQWKTGRP